MIAVKLSQAEKDQLAAAAEFLDMNLLMPRRRREQGGWYAGFNAAIRLLHDAANK